MIKPLIPSSGSMIPQWDDMPTKPAPELRPGRIQAITVDRRPDSIVMYPMVLTQMLDVRVLSIEEPHARGAVPAIVDRAEPAGDVEVLGAFVTFPVCFAAEGLVTVWECAGVGSFVAFLMFSRSRKN